MKVNIFVLTKEKGKILLIKKQWNNTKKFGA